MRPHALALIVALVVSGCASDAGDERDPTDRPARFGAPVTLPGGGGPEPIVAWGGKTLFVAAQDAGGGSPHVWASTRDGPWRILSPNTQTGGEIDLAAGRGLVVMTQLGPQGNVVSVSRDDGETWTSSPLQTLTTQYFDREWVAIDAAGSIYLVAREFGSLGQDTFSQASRSDDGGVTFVAQGRPWDAAHEPGLSNGNLVAHSGGLLMPYVCRDTFAICVATSPDRGATWTQRVVVERDVRVDNVYPAAASIAGTIVVAWSDASTGRAAVWSAMSKDAGATWSTPHRVSDASESAVLPWVASSASDVWVVYLATPVDLDAQDAAAARGATWSPSAARLEGDRVVERASVMGAVHKGAISRPVGGQSAPDRTMGDLFTALVREDGSLVVAVPQTMGGQSSTLVVMRER